jgi:hypothetical protein
MLLVDDIPRSKSAAFFIRNCKIKPHKQIPEIPQSSQKAPPIHHFLYTTPDSRDPPKSNPPAFFSCSHAHACPHFRKLKNNSFLVPPPRFFLAGQKPACHFQTNTGRCDQSRRRPDESAFSYALHFAQQFARRASPSISLPCIPPGTRNPRPCLSPTRASWTYFVDTRADPNTARSLLSLRLSPLLCSLLLSLSPRLCFLAPACGHRGAVRSPKNGSAG